MRALDRSPKTSVPPGQARHAAGACDSVVVVAGSGVLISARVSDPRVGQQIGGVVIVPLVAVSILQATGTFLLGAPGYAILATLLLALGIAGLRVGAWLFGRETILTRWR